MDRLEPDVATPAEDERERLFQYLFRELARSNVLPSNVPAFEAVYTVLCALEMRLPRRRAAELMDDVPPTLRLLLSQCAAHKTNRPEISFDEPGFQHLVGSTLHISFTDAERVTRGVFVAVQKLLSVDEILRVRDQLPAVLDALWYPLEAAGLEPSEAPAPDEAAAGIRPAEEPIEKILHEIDLSGELPTGLSAVDAMQGALCTLSQELTGHEAQELADTSRTLRALLVPCVRHRGEQPHVMHRPTFLHRLALHFGVDERRAERIAQTVFAALRGRLPPDEIHKIDGRVPRSVRPVWNP
jgi:uncharacterized protein (DUF2267 family)